PRRVVDDAGTSALVHSQCARCHRLWNSFASEWSSPNLTRDCELANSPGRQPVPPSKTIADLQVASIFRPKCESYETAPPERPSSFARSAKPPTRNWRRKPLQQLPRRSRKSFIDSPASRQWLQRFQSAEEQS